MFNDDLNKAEDRWRRRQMFRRNSGRFAVVVVWLLLVAVIGVLAWYAYYFSDQIPWDTLKASAGLQ